MTRETQVGMLVSGTFVCLVGTVLYIKLNDLDAPAARANEQTRNEMPAFRDALAGAPPNPEPVTAARGAVSPTMSIPRPLGSAVMQAKAEDLAPPPTQLPSPSTTGPDSTNVPTPRDALPVSTDSKPTPTADAAPTSPPPAADPKPTDALGSGAGWSPAGPVSPSHNAEPAADPTPAVATAPPASDPIPESRPSSSRPAADPAPAVAVAPPPSDPAPELRHGTPAGDPPPVAPLPEASADAHSPSAPPATPTEPTATQTLVGADRRLHMPEPPPAAVAPAPADPAPAPTGRQLTIPPPPPPAAISHDATPVAVDPPAPVDAPPKPAPVEPVQVASATPAALPDVKPEPVTPVAPIVDPTPPTHTAGAPAADSAAAAIVPPKPQPIGVEVAQSSTPPPVGAQPRIQSPPLPLPGAAVAHAPTPVQPQVIAFDEENYRANAGDTFQSISDKFYHSQAYDRALLLFNRDHPAATGDLTADAVAPRPGQTVYIPPLSILEDRYPQTLPNLPPLPRPHPTGSGAAKPAATVASYAATFRVPDGGLSFYQAAQQSLGSGDRWSEIYRLNPNYDPRVPLPAGAVLRLPPPAR